MERPRRPARRQHPRILNSQELARRQPLPATAPRPVFPPPEFYLTGPGKPDARLRLGDEEHAGAGQGTWRVSAAEGFHLSTGLRVGRAELFDPRSAIVENRTRSHDSFRPPWLAQTYLPKVIPRRLRAPREVRERLGALSVLMFSIDFPEIVVDAYPWCTIGKVFVGTNPDFFSAQKEGSGVLVGRNLMLTASHAVMWDADFWWMRFVPAYFSGDTPFGVSYVTACRGIRNTDDVTGRDYAICRLATPLGDRCGWMGSMAFGDDDDYLNNDSWLSMGYPASFAGGEKPSVEFLIDIEDVDSDGDGVELESEPFANAGWSGGPLWGWIDDQPRVIGIESGFEDEFSFWDFFVKTHTVFAGGHHMVDLINFGLANWPV